MNAKLTYLVNGVKQTFWTRVYPTKTFKASAALATSSVVAAALGAISWQAAAAATGYGILQIVKRDALAKLQLGIAAADPNIPHVEVK